MSLIKLEVAQQIERIAAATQNPMKYWDEEKIKNAFDKAFAALDIQSKPIKFCQSYDAAWDTASDVTSNVTNDVAWDTIKKDVAWDAAKNATWNITKDVVSDAAWHAARNAAEDIASSTAWDIARNTAKDIINNGDWNTAKDTISNGIWNTAKNIAWDVAWHAARNAAEAIASNTVWNAINDTAKDTISNGAWDTAWNAINDVAWNVAWNAALTNTDQHIQQSIIIYGLAQELIELGVGLYFVFKEEVIVAPIPKMYVDEIGRPHKTDGMAISWPDGNGYYFIHGVRFTKEEFEKDFTALEIITHKNQDQKRALAMVYGNEKLVKELKAKEISKQKDSKGNDMRILVIKDSEEDLVFYEAIDSSKNEKVYLRVPPEFATKTPAEAKVWTFPVMWQKYKETGILPTFTKES